jgi:O-antigen/teichoic acid export membrane protein
MSRPYASLGAVSGTIRRRVAFNTAVQAGGKVVVLLVGAVSIAVLTRYLGPDDYGRFALALMYVQLWGVLADVGLLTTVVREISKRPERTEELVGNVLVLRLLLSIAAIGAASAVSLLLPYDPDVRVAILLAGGPLLLGLVGGAVLAVFQARLRMGPAVLAEAAGRVAGLGLVALVALLDLGFYAVMGTAAGGAAVTTALLLLLSRGLVRLRPRAELAVWRPLLAASVPLGLALALNELYFRADTLIISLSRSYDEVGQYALAWRVLELVTAVGVVFLTSTFPVLSRLVAAGEEARVRQAVRESVELFVIFGAPLAAGAAVLAPGIVELVAGSGFDGAADPLRLLMLAAALSLVNGVFGYALIAKERQAAALWLNVAGLAFNVGLNLALVPAYGIVAAAVVTVASEVLILAGSWWLMRRHFGFFPRPVVLPAALGCAAAMAAVLWPLRDAPVLLPAALGAAVYGVLLWAVSARSRELVAGLRA